MYALKGGVFESLCTVKQRNALMQLKRTYYAIKHLNIQVNNRKKMHS